ncbi:FxDxF family PEP-CTERM protein [Pseudoduganella chitinolytica]|uniref:FxDxF family PEP-CTERM protein n=1 Tax=Pseudoduganella chitinolytica TaxID=34070 RepID=A0ABY8BN47_9BURK|nr:FxDxF family PEP-CTERM protein [Pseudoduganella chitinolytica]WEF35779.1 FxDxF family PEP-CTERM protein [Pseudoduganella chitinolytica]
MNITKFFRAALVIGALFAGLTQSAQADIYTHTGDTTGGPTYNRPLEGLSDLSAIGTDVAYRTFNFNLSAMGEYTFLLTSDYDGFMFIYQDSFDAADPLTNALGGSDDLFGGTTSGFYGDLDAGNYVLVFTGYANNDAGKFSVTIGGPGVITAVPEPATYMMLALGLAAVGYAQRRKMQR